MLLDKNHDNIRYANSNMLMADSQGKFNDLLWKIVMKTKKKGVIINYKKRECMVASKRGNSSYEI